MNSTITSGINEHIEYGITPEERNAFLHALRQASLKKILFVTIRCPTQKSSWVRLGKTIDWLKRYSKHFYVVKGTANGEHMHALMIHNTGKTIRYQKGIHFNVVNMTKDSIVVSDYNELKENKEKVEYYKNKRYERLTISEHIKKQEHIAAICSMVTKYWRLIAQRAVRHEKRDVKTENYIRLLNYLDKNLNEPREDEPQRYNDYLYYCKV